jgi:hypothetical protein
MPDTEHIEHGAVRFEPTDINPRAVILTGLGVVAVTIAIAGLMHFVAAPLTRARQQEGAQTQAAGAVPRELPPMPRLQSSDAAELKSYRDAQMGQLNHYNWIDRDKGVIGIPIQRAMELIEQRGISPQKAGAGFTYNPPQAGTRETGFEGKVEPEPR